MQKRVSINRLIIILFLLTSATTLFAQPCDCKKVVQDVIKEVETNYAGFKDKATPAKEHIYRLFKEKAAAEAALGKLQCVEIIDGYLRFFRDPHLFVNDNKTGPMQKNKTLRIKPFKEEDLSIKGIWYSTTDESAVYMQEENGRIRGYTVKAGDTAVGYGSLEFDFKETGKNTYRGMAYNKYEQAVMYTATHHERNLLHIRSLATYTRNKQAFKAYNEFKFSMLNDSVSYIKFHSFSSYFRKQIDTLVQNNRAKIENSKYLIIDVRGNGGGSITSFYKIFDFIYTNPTQFVSGYYYASPEVISRTKQELEEARKNADTAGIRSLEKDLREYEAHAGTLYLDSPSTMRRNIIYPRPEKVVILADGNTGSAAEMFIIMAKQNSKTITAGTNTAGGADYVEPLFYWFCDSKYMVAIPHIKRSRLEYKNDIDNIGIPPDIPIKAPYDKWVDYVLKNILPKAK